MLLPIVWFEESAQIPEEAARKFKSLYTNRIRAINLTLLSLFLASLALLAIDLRLMLGANYWRKLKFQRPIERPQARARRIKTTGEQLAKSRGDSYHSRQPERAWRADSQWSPNSDSDPDSYSDSEGEPSRPAPQTTGGSGSAEIGRAHV